jgi:hypothetical protein
LAQCLSVDAQPGLPPAGSGSGVFHGRLNIRILSIDLRKFVAYSIFYAA